MRVKKRKKKKSVLHVTGSQNGKKGDEEKGVAKRVRKRKRNGTEEGVSVTGRNGQDDFVTESQSQSHMDETTPICLVLTGSRLSSRTITVTFVSFRGSISDPSY